MRLGSTYVSVEVEIEEVLDRLNESKLLEYCTERLGSGKIPIDAAFETIVREAYELLCSGENSMAQLRLEQALFPKFKNVGACLEIYKARVHA